MTLWEILLAFQLCRLVKWRQRILRYLLKFAQPLHDEVEIWRQIVWLQSLYSQPPSYPSCPHVEREQQRPFKTTQCLVSHTRISEDCCCNLHITLAAWLPLTLVLQKRKASLLCFCFLFLFMTILRFQSIFWTKNLEICALCYVSLCGLKVQLGECLTLLLQPFTFFYAHYNAVPKALAFFFLFWLDTSFLGNNTDDT